MKSKIILSAAAAIVALAACNKDAPTPKASEPITNEQGVLSVAIRTPQAPSTKAVNPDAYVTAQDFEKDVTSLQLFVFDANGDLDYYQAFEQSALDAYNTNCTALTASATVKVGPKDVWAVANGDDYSQVATLADLKAEALDLGSNDSVDKTKGFVMAGSATATVVVTAPVTASIEVSRFAVRVALKEIANELPSNYPDLVIDGCFLSNVAGNQTIEGVLGASASDTTWYNKAALMDETPLDATHKIGVGNYKASCEELTFHAQNETIVNKASKSYDTPLFFYGFENIDKKESDTFTGTFVPCMTNLVIYGHIGDPNGTYPQGSILGKTRYWVIPMDKGFARNTAYTVKAAIKGTGSDDPNKPVKAGQINAEITVADWIEGEVYEPDLF